jgi:hypothetical protein
MPTKATNWVVVDRFSTEESVARQDIFQAAKGKTNPETKKSRSINRAQKEESFQALVGKFPILPLKVFMGTILTFFD